MPTMIVKNKLNLIYVSIKKHIKRNKYWYSVLMSLDALFCFAVLTSVEGGMSLQTLLWLVLLNWWIISLALALHNDTRGDRF